MYECDICGRVKYESEFYSVTRSGPPYYDFLCICNECHKKMEEENGRKEEHNSNHQQPE